jgi:hypothetical protein
MLPQLGFGFGILRNFQARPLGLGRARSWGSRVGITQPALYKDRANGRCSKAAYATAAHGALVFGVGDVALRMPS